MAIALKSNGKDVYLAAALIVALSASIYWLVLISHAYGVFLDGSKDLMFYSYNLYFNMHYPSIAHGLQFITISNHISPDMLLIMPLFYAYPHSMTLLYIQTIIICLASLIVFVAARKLTGAPPIALSLSIAFLLNPGITGILSYDFHIEFLIIPFYLLTFYFYMTSNKKLFAVSLLLLLGTMEVAPLPALALGLGLLAYELSRSKWKEIEKSKRAMLAAIIIASIATGVLYYAGIRYLVASYGTSYGQLPNFFRVTAGSEVGILSDLHSLSIGPIRFLSSSLSFYTSSNLALAALALSVLIIFLGFGFFTLRRPGITLLLLIPWFIPAIIWSVKGAFIYTGGPYYSFTTGATISAAMIGAVSSGKRPDEYPRPKLMLVSASIVFISLLLCFVSLALAPNPLSFLANLSNNAPIYVYNGSQINTLARVIPQNASLMTQYVISPHLIDREHLESTWSLGMNGTYFVPEYILVAYNNTDVYSNGTFDLYDYSVGNHNYTLYAHEGYARLYRISN